MHDPNDTPRRERDDSHDDDYRAERLADQRALNELMRDIDEEARL